MQIWTPTSAAESVRACNICGKKYGMRQRQAFIAHADKCSRKNEEVIEAAIEQERGGDSAFNDQESWRERYEYERDKAAAKGIPVKGGNPDAHTNRRAR